MIDGCLTQAIACLTCRKSTNKGGLCRRKLNVLILRGGIIVLAALLISTVGGWAGGTTTDTERAPASGTELLGELRSLRQQLDAKQGELEVARLQLDRVDAIMQYSTHYRLPADYGDGGLRRRAERGDRPRPGVSVW